MILIIMTEKDEIRTFQKRIDSFDDIKNEILAFCQHHDIDKCSYTVSGIAEIKTEVQLKKSEAILGALFG